MRVGTAVFAIIMAAGLGGLGCKASGGVDETADRPEAPAASKGASGATPPGARSSGPRSLVSEVEIQALKDALDAQIADNLSRRCPAPPLRGEARPGPADEDIEAILRPTRPDLVRCAELATDRKDAVSTWLDAGGPAPEPVAALLAACAPLEAAVQAAASHEDSCSPYLAGRRGLPRLMRVLALGRAVDGRARLLMDAGRAEDALALGLDWMRVMQHLSRSSGAPLLAAMVGTAAMQQTVDAVIAPVLAGAPLSAEALALTDRALGMLVAGEPAFADFLPYERAGAALNMMLPFINGPTWEPPGGFDEDHVAAPEGASEGLRSSEMAGIDDRQTMMLAWIAFDATTRRMEEACPPAASLSACRAGLRAAEKARTPGGARPVLDRWLSIAMAEDPHAAVRQQILEIMEDVATPSYWRYVDRLALRRFLLTALRVHVAARQAGACPDPSALAEGPWPGRLQVPGVDQPIAALSDAGETVLSVPEGLLEDAGPTGRYVLRCPTP